MNIKVHYFAATYGQIARNLGYGNSINATKRIKQMLG